MVKMRRMKMRFSKTNRAFHIIFLLAFGWIVVNVFLLLGGQNAFCVLAGAALAAVAVIAYKLLEKHAKKRHIEHYDKVFWIMFVVMFLLQVLMGYLLMYEPGSDLKAVHSFAKGVAATGSFSNTYDLYPSAQGYMARYPNNNGIFLLLTGYYRVLYLIFGKVPLSGAIFLNVIALSASVFFIYQTAKKIFSAAGAFLTFLLCFFFLPFYTYTPFFYTDTLSMPFVIIPLFLYISALKTKRTAGRYIYLILSAALVFAGYSLKGSAAIILIGAVVFLFLSVPAKRAFACMSTVIGVFLVCMLAFNSLVAVLNFAPPEQLNERQYPVTHWIMMGLKGNGGYNRADSNFTDKSGTYDEKKAANIEEIKKRLKDYGPVGLLSHLTEKGTWTWSDGTYYISNHIWNEPHRPNILHQFLLRNGRYHGSFVFASNMFHLMTLLMICLSALTSIIRPRMNFSVLLKGLIFGVFLFFLVWEARPRYLLNFAPVYLLVAADGIIAVADFKWKRSKKERSGNRLDAPAV